MAVVAHARVSCALFPLVNKSGNELVDWVSCAFPEYCSRALAAAEGFQIWEPAFLFPIDSSGWELESDSLLERHQARWKWNAAIGGIYDADDDSIRLQLRIVQAGERSFIKKVLSGRAKKEKIIPLMRQLSGDLILLLDPDNGPAAIKKLPPAAAVSLPAYSTYAAGYGFEMRRRFADAITAYAKARELDGGFVPTRWHMGRLFAQSGDPASGRSYIESAFKLSQNDPLTTAIMADFTLLHDIPGRALKFVDQQRLILEQTALGLTILGRANLMQGEFQRAIAVLTRAVAFGPWNLEADFILGNAYFSSGQFEQATEIFNRLVKFRPDYMRYYSSLGAAYRSAGRLMESVQILENALKLDPENTTTLINLADTYFRLGWYEKAEELLLQAQNMDPELSEIELNLGVVYWHLGRKQESDRIFMLAARQHQQAQFALNNQGNTYFLRGEVDKAIAAYRRADRAGKKNETVLYNIAMACLEARRLKDAVFYLEEVLRLSPGRMDVLVRLADIEAQRRHSEKAEMYYRKILELAPQYETALAGLVGILTAQKRGEEAIEYIESYLESYPNNKRVRFLLGRTYEDMGWYEVAIMKYEELISLFPKEPEAHLGLGRVLYSFITLKNGTEYDKAIYALKTAAQALPADPQPDYLIGNLYQARNMRELAVDSWKSALQKAKDKKLRSRLQSLIANAAR